MNMDAGETRTFAAAEIAANDGVPGTFRTMFVQHDEYIDRCQSGLGAPGSGEAESGPWTACRLEHISEGFRPPRTLPGIFVATVVVFAGHSHVLMRMARLWEKS
jgi:hypothetical protein